MTGQRLFLKIRDCQTGIPGINASDLRVLLSG